jgi:hypothetical protein
MGILSIEWDVASVVAEGLSLRRADLSVRADNASTLRRHRSRSETVTEK